MDWECCWNKPEISPTECSSIGEGEEELYTAHRRRILEKCLECPRFKNDLQKLRETGHPLADLLPLVTGELLEQRERIQSMGSFLTSRTREIKFLHELNIVLQTSLDLDEVLSVAMTAITAGKGFGLNRALLLMTDKERQNLRGYLGVGPRNYEEAWQIWQEIGQNNLTLRELARNFQQTKLESEKVKFHDLLEKLTTPLSDYRHIFNRSLRERKTILVEDAFHNPDVDPALARLLGVDSFLVMPLISRNRRIGIILADNCITHKAISPQDIQLLETFAFPVAFSLERASLYERLQEEVDKLTVANAKLKEQQELILKMEKMALVGQITSSIAHSIRNPLMIIGGFARSLMKTVVAEGRNREYLESIMHEAKQLENVLEEVLSYADSLHPAMDDWDVNQLVSAVFAKYEESMEQQGITCSLHLAPDLPAAYIDYKQIAFCIRTVLKTLMESSDAARMSIATRREDRAVAIEIEDDGKRPALEDDEVSGPSSTALRALGSDLAFQLCRSILEKQGSPLVIEAAAGGGTRYTIRLPLRKEDD